MVFLGTDFIVFWLEFSSYIHISIPCHDYCGTFTYNFGPLDCFCVRVNGMIVLFFKPTKLHTLVWATHIRLSASKYQWDFYWRFDKLCWLFRNNTYFSIALEFLVININKRHEWYPIFRVNSCSCEILIRIHWWLLIHPTWNEWLAWTFQANLFHINLNYTFTGYIFKSEGIVNNIRDQCTYICN